MTWRRRDAQEVVLGVGGRESRCRGAGASLHQGTPATAPAPRQRGQPGLDRRWVACAAVEQAVQKLAPRVCPARIRLRRKDRAGRARRDAGGIRIDGGARAGGGGLAGQRIGREGPEVRRHRLRLERRHRRRVDGAGLQPGRDARLHRRRPGVGLSAPAVLLVSFIPMLFIAFAYSYMNRADPDCGTSFAWVTRAMGPQLGWLARLGDHRRRHHRHGQPGADRRHLLVPALRLAVGGRHELGGDARRRRLDRGHDVDLRDRHRAQRRDAEWLLSAEILTLALFAVVALVKVAVDRRADRGRRQPRAGSTRSTSPASTRSSTACCSASSSTGGGTAAVAVNEESQDRHTGPGQAAVMSTILLVLIYVVVSFAAQAYGGEKLLVDNADDVLSVLGSQVFGSPLDKLLIIAVLSSAAASTQTTILPTARTSLSMARWGALPKIFGRSARASRRRRSRRSRWASSRSSGTSRSTSSARTSSATRSPRSAS